MAPFFCTLVYAWRGNIFEFNSSDIINESICFFFNSLSIKYSFF